MADVCDQIHEEEALSAHLAQGDGGDPSKLPRLLAPLPRRILGPPPVPPELELVFDLALLFAPGFEYLGFAVDLHLGPIVPLPGVPRSLFLAPLSPAAHDAIVRLHKRWGVSAPPMPPNEAVIVVNERGVVVASVYLYETSQWLFVEYLVTNEDFPRRIRYMACVAMLNSVVASAAAKGLYILATPRSLGAQRLMERAGFRNSGIPMWVRPRKGVPLWTEAATAPIPSGPKKAPPKTPRRAPPPEEAPEPDSYRGAGWTAFDNSDPDEEPEPEIRPPVFRKASEQGDRRRSRQGSRSGLG